MIENRALTLVLSRFHISSPFPPERSNVHSLLVHNRYRIRASALKTTQRLSAELAVSGCHNSHCSTILMCHAPVALFRRPLPVDDVDRKE